MGKDADVPLRLVVDGETFDVRFQESQWHADWVSGRNSAYGFSESFHGDRPGSAVLEAHIGEFLAGINPATGYLD